MKTGIHWLPIANINSLKQKNDQHGLGSDMTGATGDSIYLELPLGTILFVIPEENKVELIVYTIKGQKIKQLVRNQLSAGVHSVVWNGKDENDQSVSSGVYFYRLKAGNFEKSKKMVLLR